MGRVDNISQLTQYKQCPEGESKEQDVYRAKEVEPEYL